MSSDNVVSVEKFTSNKNIVVKKEPIKTVLFTDISRRNNFSGPGIKQNLSQVDHTDKQLDSRKVCVKKRLTEIFPTPAAAVSLSSRTIPKKEFKPAKVPNKKRKRKKRVCFICGEKFFKRSELRKHRVDAHGYYGRKCEECGVQMTNKKKKMLEHLRIHHPHKLVICDVCGRGFFKPQDLRKHYRCHRGQSYQNWYVPTFENSASGSNSMGGFFQTQAFQKHYRCIRGQNHRNWYEPTFKNTESGSNSMGNYDIPCGPTVKAEITDACDSKNISCDTIPCNKDSKFQSIKAEPIEESDWKNTNCDSATSNQKSKVQWIKVEPNDEND